jgi:hypothetical protein
VFTSILTTLQQISEEHVSLLDISFINVCQLSSRIISICESSIVKFKNTLQVFFASIEFIAVHSMVSYFNSL